MHNTMSMCHQVFLHNLFFKTFTPIYYKEITSYFLAYDFCKINNKIGLNNLRYVSNVIYVFDSVSVRNLR